ncbi:MAG: hypothetical protein K2Y56_25665 [Methylobacterium sp.]|uniref:hypothetical protein n=1 Tax=Methylobacterium sp. TaxID=409 RepID=UPI0025CD8DE9|nr:hypothetical protein [Methylobacterium sp.]MBX9934858.1 hypothetical protein [Methylobacterium sp.]
MSETPSNLFEVTLLCDAIQAVRVSGCAVIEAGERAGLYRVNDGPALQSAQNVAYALDLARWISA